MNKLTLSSGLTYCTLDDGSKRCTGAGMGRRNVLPADTNAPIKLQMERLQWVDGDYDSKGCYWGGGMGDFIYCAHAGNVMVFVRSVSRTDAKKRVKESLPLARFYR